MPPQTKPRKDSLTAAELIAKRVGEYIMREEDRILGSNTEGTLTCPDHNMPLNFWFEKEKHYKCLKCLINEQDVHFVDHGYKKQEARFEEIKTQIEGTLEENKLMPRTIKDWKEDIRDLILRVRAQMIGFIDGFTSRIIKQISRIEQDKREVAAVSSEDRRQGERLDFIKEKLIRTNEILKTIEDTQPNMRADLVKTQIEEMENIERLVQEKD